VTYTHTDPVICAAVANGVAQDFIDQNFEKQTERFTSASKWLDTTTRELMGKVERAEQDLTDYTKAHNIFANRRQRDSDYGQALPPPRSSYSHRNRSHIETVGLRNSEGRSHVRTAAAFSDPKITTLQTRLDELRANLENFNLKYGQEHPQIVSAKLQIKTTEAQLDSSRKALEDKLKGEYELAVS